MAHIFKPGDKAYWLMEKRWIELLEGSNHPSYPLEERSSHLSFTADGRGIVGEPIVLLPLNPYDPADPNNPPEFRYPFMLNGRPVRIGDKLACRPLGNTIVQVKSLKLGSFMDTFSVSEPGTDCYFPSDEFCWPDELPVKKKVAKWAYPTIGVSGRLTVYFTEEITEEEARKVCGSSVEMIPGTEREVEG